MRRRGFPGGAAALRRGQAEGGGAPLLPVASPAEHEAAPQVRVGVSVMGAEAAAAAPPASPVPGGLRRGGGAPRPCHRRAAIACLVGLSAYLRPGELCGLRAKDLVAPAPGYGEAYRCWSLILGASDLGDGTKTGVYDDNVRLDHEELQFIGPFLADLKSRRRPEDCLWDFAQVDLNRWMGQASRDAGVEQLGIVPYALRHSGPSWDVLTGRRHLAEVQRRGRWASPASLARYEKSSKITEQLSHLSAETASFLQVSARDLGAILQGGQRPPQPPGLRRGNTSSTFSRAVVEWRDPSRVQV